MVERIYSKMTLNGNPSSLSSTGIPINEYAN